VALRSFLMKRLFISSAALVLIILTAAGLFSFNIALKFKDLFRYNKLRQEQGYYTAEFEFKLLGIGYSFDKGEYSRSYSLFSKLYKEMSTGEGLVKMPAFRSDSEELEFYLNLQDPQTGAFMDREYPLCSYHGPTENTLIHMAKLAERLNMPLRLKYPLSYLDSINTPEKLILYLNDISTVGFIASKFPQTTFHNTRDLITLMRETDKSTDGEEHVIRKYGFYEFSPEWRHALLEWFYNAQDPATGLWGPKSESGELRKNDLSNTVSIVKAFVDDNGDDIYPGYPLRYRHQLIESAIRKMSMTVPEDSETDRIHEWDLVMTKTTKMLVRYLMKYADDEDRLNIRRLIDDYINVKFEKYYREIDGAFSHYPGSSRADLDGSAFFFLFRDIGAFSSIAQREIWGFGPEDIADMGEVKVRSADEVGKVLETLKGNSVRIYAAVPDFDDLISGVTAVGYLPAAEIPDIIEMTVRMRKWLNTTDLTMGNWVSKADLQERMKSISVPDVKHTDDLQGNIFQTAQEKGTVYAVVFDIMQIPVCMIEFSAD